MELYLVRHAHAGDSDRWRGDDRSRPLSERGRRQAQGLAVALQAATVENVLSSPYLRCVQTMEPLASARSLPVRTERLLAEGADWRETLALICDLPGPAVMCSQGDVIGGIVGELVSRSLVEPAEARWQKGSTWVLEVRDGDVRSARYQPPVEVGTDDPPKENPPRQGHH